MKSTAKERRYYFKYYNCEVKDKRTIDFKK